MRYFAVILLALILSGCAKPTYVEKKVSPTTNNAQSSDCPDYHKLENLCVSIVWQKSPSDEEYGSMLVKTHRPNLADGSMVFTDLSLDPEVYLWMPSMGHGSVPTSVVKLDTGTYLVSNIYFIMPGDWEIRVQIKSESHSESQLSEVSFPYYY